MGKSMCRLNADVKVRASAQSLGLVPVREMLDLALEPHPGWSQSEQDKINKYVDQLPLLFEGSGEIERLSSVARRPLEAPRLRGYYLWRCDGCSSSGHHRQGILDWEFVALQRNIGDVSDTELMERVRAKFLTEMFSPVRESSVYVGNQAKRPHVFSVLGVFWPKR